MVKEKEITYPTSFRNEEGCERNRQVQHECEQIPDLEEK